MYTDTAPSRFYQNSWDLAPSQPWKHVDDDLAELVEVLGTDSGYLDIGCQIALQQGLLKLQEAAEWFREANVQRLGAPHEVARSLSNLQFGFWMRATVGDRGAPPSLAKTGQDRRLRYFPLDPSRNEIRLLRMWVSPVTHSLEAETMIVSLDDSPSYEALSYVWGNPNYSSALTVDGVDVPIPQGASQALPDLITDYSHRLIWLDAICIDQFSDTEKNHQIQIMDRIFAQAERVLVHLGPSNPQSDTGMQTLQQLMTHHPTGSVPPWSIRSVFETQSALRDILSRAYFTRVWTVQEVVLAQKTTLICGYERVTWRSDFATLKRIVFRIKAAAISPLLTTRPEIQGADYTGTLDWDPLLELLETQMRQAARRESQVLRRTQLDIAYGFRHRQSHDARDKYHAILGIIEDDAGRRLPFKPDYSRSVEETHNEFIKQVASLAESELDRQMVLTGLQSTSAVDKDGSDGDLDGLGQLELA